MIFSLLFAEFHFNSSTGLVPLSADGFSGFEDSFEPTTWCQIPWFELTKVWFDRVPQVNCNFWREIQAPSLGKQTSGLRRSSKPPEACVLWLVLVGFVFARYFAGWDCLEVTPDSNGNWPALKGAAFL